MLGRLAVVVLLALLVAGTASAGARPGTDPASHYVPKVDDTFTYAETIAVRGGYGNYSGYTETDYVNGTLNVTAVLPNGTETATFDYVGHYVNSEGQDYPWTESGTFTFSAVTFDYVHGTDGQPGDNGTEVWFYMNDSLPATSTLDPLGTPMTIVSLGTSYPTGSGTYVRTIYAVGTGTYERDDSYGEFLATYDWRSYFDPGTGYIVGYNYTELDDDGHGDGFVYTDDLHVTKTSYTLTAAEPPETYGVDFGATGLASGTPWTLTFDGVARAATGASYVVLGVPNGTYLYGVSASGYTASPALGFVTVDGSSPTVPPIAFASTSGAGGDALLYAEVAIALLVVVVVVVLVYALARRSRRGPPLPRHSEGGRPQYGSMPPGPPPPPISLTPRDQPQIQQVVVKEVVKVNCRYCGSLIDSTAEKCPFCGATRS